MNMAMGQLTSTWLSPADAKRLKISQLFISCQTRSSWISAHLMNSTLTSVGTRLFSFWSPSLGPTWPSVHIGFLTGTNFDEILPYIILTPGKKSHLHNSDWRWQRVHVCRWRVQAAVKEKWEEIEDFLSPMQILRCLQISQVWISCCTWISNDVFLYVQGLHGHNQWFLIIHLCLVKLQHCVQRLFLKWWCWILNVLSIILKVVSCVYCVS